MLQYYIENRQDFKVKIIIRGCLSPLDKKCVEYIREQYNDKNELTDSSMYQFFMNDEQLISLGKILVDMK